MTPAPKPTPVVRAPKLLKSTPHRIPDSVRRQAFVMWGMTCRWCGVEGGALDLHHIRRRSQGGADRWENLRPVHRICHGRIHDSPAEAKRRGFLDDPADRYDDTEARLQLADDLERLLGSDD